MMNSNEQTIENKPKKKERGAFASILIYALLGLVFAFTIRMVVEPTVVIGQSMEPTLHEGQYMLNLKTAYKVSEPKHGDVVIVDAEGDHLDVRFLIKRVIGVPGDTITINDNLVYRNGELLNEPYILEMMEGTENMEVVVPEDEVFVMGDNRNNSLDSRNIGPINYKEEVRGKVVLSLKPFDQSFKKQ